MLVPLGPRSQARRELSSSRAHGGHLLDVGCVILVAAAHFLVVRGLVANALTAGYRALILEQFHTRKRLMKAERDILKKSRPTLSDAI
jgi:hypothetical protein